MMSARGFASCAFRAAVLYSAFSALGSVAVGAPGSVRIDVDPDQAPYSAIKPLALQGNETCTLQFGPSRQVATTAAHCLDFIILGIDNAALVRNPNGYDYRVTQIYIPEKYDPRDTGSKMYFDKAILVLDRPVQGEVSLFNLRAAGSDSELSLSVTQAGYTAEKNGALSANLSCTLSQPQFHANGRDFVLKHDCRIAPGDSGSAAWDRGTRDQRAIITSLNYAVPLTQVFIDAYHEIARSFSESRSATGFMKVSLRGTAPSPEQQGNKLSVFPCSLLKPHKHR